MAIALNPIFPVVGPKPASGDIVLQPGSVINAQVLKLLENNLVRIAIAALSIDVLSEVQLQPGQNLQLAVSQTPQGIRLAVVPSGGGAVATPELANAAALQTVAAAKPAVPTQNLTDLQALAVSSAVQTAASRQTGLSQLFANLAAATGTQSLPPQVQQAVVQLFALQPELSDNLTGPKVQAAFEASGLFREKTLAAAATSPSPASSPAIPDLKSALIVLRQTLTAALATSVAAEGASALPGQAAQPNAVNSGVIPSAVQQPVSAPSSPTAGVALPTASVAGSPASTLAVSPPLAPNAEVQEILLPQARIRDPAAEARAGGAVFNVTRPGGAVAPIASDAFFDLIQNALQIARSDAGASASARALGQSLPDLDPGFARTNVPPPPFRGAAPSAQPVAAQTLAADVSAQTTVRQLLDDTEGAIARQTLLQIASLPDRADGLGVRADARVDVRLDTPRWNFEIPFVTPLGTAVAQFEVGRDGGGSEAGAAKRVWRARFSLDVEPAGPVHAIISLTGETTSVRMWAERPVTAAQLRASTAELAHALRSAELEPGDIIIGEGSPPQPAAPAGHFLDRAL